MPELLPAIERDIHALSAKTAKTLELLAGSHGLSNPVLYQRVIREIRELRRMWDDHRAELSRILPGVLHYDSDSETTLEKIERNAAAVGDQLQALSSAGWPRNPEIGVRSIRVRGKGVLTGLLRQLDTERTIVVPLLHRWKLSKREATTGHLASV